MASKLLEELKAYFENTPREQIIADWKKTKGYEEVDITADDFLASIFFERVEFITNIYSPKFSSGFFFN